MKNILIKAVFVIALSLSASSCGERIVDLENEEAKLRLKTKQLEYLSELYRVKKDIVFDEKIRVIDSLILNQSKAIDSLK